MKISFLPKSLLGTWSVGLNIFFLLVSVFLYIFAEVQNVITSDVLVTILGAPAVIASLAAFFTGVIAIIKSKDRSIMVFLSVIIGLVVLTFIIVDIMNGLLSYLNG